MGWGACKGCEGHGGHILDKLRACETSTIFTRRKEDSSFEIADTSDGRSADESDLSPRTPMGVLARFSFEC